MSENEKKATTSTKVCVLCGEKKSNVEHHCDSHEASPEDDCCDATCRFWCTRKAGHPGEHVAHDVAGFAVSRWAER